MTRAEVHTARKTPTHKPGGVLVLSWGVVCGWCRDLFLTGRGCARCFAARRFHASLAESSLKLWYALAADDLQGALFADHLEEIGHPQAGRYRREWMP